MGKVLDFGIRPLKVVSVNLPDKHLKEAHYANDRYHTFLMQPWLQNGEPQLFDLSMDSPGLGTGCLNSFNASGIQNIAAHGLFDIYREHVTFFSFHQLPSSPGIEQRGLLKLTVPAMHEAFLRCIQPQVLPATRTSTTRPLLTCRESEVLGWMCQGKSNSEIGSILQVSPHTVKNHAQSILTEMKVSTHAQAASKAMRLRLVSYN